MDKKDMGKITAEMRLGKRTEYIILREDVERLRLSRL